MKAAVCYEFGKALVIEDLELDPPQTGELRVKLAACAICHSDPDTLSLESASLLACGVITGFGAVTNTAQIPSGSSVVVIGTGGVGLNSVQGAVVSGAHRVIAMDIMDEKLDAARSFGATHTINSAKENALEAVHALTAERQGN